MRIRRIISNSNDMIVFIVICVIVYVIKFVDWWFDKIKVNVKVNILKDIMKKNCWIVVLKNLVIMLIKLDKWFLVVDKFDLCVLFIGKFGLSVLFIDKFDILLGLLFFGNIKVIVSKDNFMILVEIKGFVFFKVLVVFVIFWGVEELFVL